MSRTRLIVFASLLLVLSHNVSFFKNVVAVYPFSAANIAFLGSLVLVLTFFLLLSFTLLSWKYTTKTLLIVIFLVSSIAAYFTDTYNVIIDRDMVQNAFQTDFDETLGLFSYRLILYFLFLGLLPAIVVFCVKIESVSLKKELLSKLKLAILSALVIVSLLLGFGKFYASFFREHKPLRYYANPITCIYSTIKYVKGSMNSGTVLVHPIGTDAKIPATDLDRELIILVIGEAVRADRLSLNGYHRETNPLLQKEDVISFPNFYSCGTSTATSLPCMFSNLGQANYSDKKVASQENLLDVLDYAGVHVLWRENNSSSKGVASRASYEDYRKPQKNTVCDPECRDEGMLVGLQKYIDRGKTGDILIVLHQMGNHGPEYYKRYPEAFEKFTPVCRTNQLEKCTDEQIGNAYDNAVLYTDYFLKKTIDLLKNNSDRFETAMVYFSDHGESLGESGLYLHGLPYYMAPDCQKHIAAIMWFGDSFKIDKISLKEKSTHLFSHDNLFHTILGLMEIDSSAYDKDLDIIHCDP
jgi:lipid A ethanolaminephosphotransferase